MSRTTTGRSSTRGTSPGGCVRWRTRTDGGHAKEEPKKPGKKSEKNLKRRHRRALAQKQLRLGRRFKVTLFEISKYSELRQEHGHCRCPPQYLVEPALPIHT